MVQRSFKFNAKDFAQRPKNLTLSPVPGVRFEAEVYPLALHSPTDDPPEGHPGSWPGEAKISGRGVPVGAPDSPDQGARFRVEISDVVLTHLNDAGDRLVVDSWHPGRGRNRIERR